MVGAILGVLIRFGEYENLKKIINKGEIYINPITIHKNNTKNNQRGDNDENLLLCTNNTQVYINNRLIATDIILKVNSNTNYYTYSFFCMPFKELIKNKEVEIPKKLIENLGGSCILFTNDKIIKRIVEELKNKNLNPQTKPVDYMNLNNLQQFTDIFTKDIRFKEQREFRIVAKTTNILPLKFNIKKLTNKDAILIKDITNIIFKNNNKKLQCYIQTKDFKQHQITI